MKATKSNSAPKERPSPRSPQKHLSQRAEGITLDFMPLQKKVEVEEILGSKSQFWGSKAHGHPKGQPSERQHAEVGTNPVKLREINIA